MSIELTKRILSSIILIPFSFYLIIKGSHFFNFFLLVCFLLTSFEWFKMSKSKIYHIFGHILIIFSFYCAYNLRNNFNDESLIIFLLIIITCISTDMGGYIFGKIFKGKKISKISPNKTISGIIGSFIFAVLSVFFISFIVSLMSGIENNFFLKPKYFILALFFSLAAQLGDLFISYFKRLEKLKDTGKILPGHGGIFDRIDGLMFVVILAYILYTLKVFP